MVVLVGVKHVAANLRNCKRLIDEAHRNGIRRIGLERGLSPAAIESLKKRFSHKFPDYNWQRAMDTGFFNQLTAYAKSKGMSVTPLGSQFYFEYFHRLRIERAPANNKLPLPPKWYNNLHIAGSEKSSQLMAKTIQKEALPFSIVGAGHALEASKHLKIPVDEIRLVGITLEELLMTQSRHKQKAQWIKLGKKIRRKKIRLVRAIHRK